MFSDNPRKIEEVPYQTLLLISAGLVFLCQLVAMVLVLSSQVEKAQIREARGGSARLVADDCSENYSGAMRTRCIERMKAQLAAEPLPIAESDSRLEPMVRVVTPLDGGIRSVQRAVFEARR